MVSSGGNDLQVAIGLIHLNPGYHMDHYHKYTNGLPMAEVTLHLEAGVKGYEAVPFGFDNKPRRYIIQADNTGDIRLTDDLGREI